MSVANSEPLVRDVPSNQVPAMADFNRLSYAMPPGAAAIAQSRANLPAGAQPLYGGIGDIPGLDQLGMSFGSPGAGADVQTMQAATPAAPQFNLMPGQQVQDGATARANYLASLGPDNQTASGGVTGPDYTTPGAWEAFFNRPLRGAQPVTTPPVMSPQRLQTGSVQPFTRRSMANA